MANIRLKIDRLDLIASLENVLAKNAKTVKDNEAKGKKIAALRIAHAKEALKMLKVADITEVTVHHNWRTERLESMRFEFANKVDFAAFTTPEELEVEHAFGEYEIRQIEGVLKMLRLSKETSISTSALGNVQQFL